MNDGNINRSAHLYSSAGFLFTLKKILDEEKCLVLKNSVQRTRFILSAIFSVKELG